MKKNRLLIGASDHDANMLYATGFFVPDAFIWFCKGGQSFAVLSPLEIDRAKREAKVDEVLSLRLLEEEMMGERGKAGRPSLGEVCGYVLKKYRIRHVEVPSDFPILYGRSLEASGIRVSVCEGEFFPERAIKDKGEVQAITRGQRLAEEGMRRAVEILEHAEIRKRVIYWGGKRLTSEILRGEIDACISRSGGLPAHTIVAGGEQACDPHEKGSGVLKANETIIIDIFPRDQKSGYFGDLTRTFVKGKANDSQRKLYKTVLEGQKSALKAMRAGVSGKKIHEGVLRYFEEEGYPTEMQNGRWVGFFHGTGHSLGLEIHEAPRFASGGFKAGHVMTVEPGLYYPGVGGVRIEDLVVVQEEGVQNLTRMPKLVKSFEIR